MVSGSQLAFGFGQVEGTAVGFRISGKELLPFNEYAKMFNEDQEKFNRESILEINFRNGDTSGYSLKGSKIGRAHD